MNRNLTIRSSSNSSCGEMLSQIQRSAGNMGELSPAFPKAWIGQKAKAEPVTLRFLTKEDLVYKKTAPEDPPAIPTA